MQMRHPLKEGELKTQIFRSRCEKKKVRKKKKGKNQNGKKKKNEIFARLFLMSDRLSFSRSMSEAPSEHTTNNPSRVVERRVFFTVPAVILMRVLVNPLTSSYSCRLILHNARLAGQHFSAVLHVRIVSEFSIRLL